MTDLFTKEQKQILADRVFRVVRDLTHVVNDAHAAGLSVSISPAADLLTGKIVFTTIVQETHRFNPSAISSPEEL